MNFMKPQVFMIWAMPAVGTLLYLIQVLKFSDGVNLFFALVIAALASLCTLRIFKKRNHLKPVDERENWIYLEATATAFFLGVVAWIPLTFINLSSGKSLHLLMFFMWAVQNLLFFARRNS